MLHEKNRQREREIELAEQVRAAEEAHPARELVLAEQARRVKEDQQTREARLGDKARRVSLDEANAGHAWQHVQHNAADVERPVREAEERDYARATHEAAARETAAREAVLCDATNRASDQARLQQPGVNAPTGGALVSGSTSVPLAKDAKLDIRVFTGKELHKSLGGGFKQ